MMMESAMEKEVGKASAASSGSSKRFINLIFFFLAW